jgi:hypothetical protein
MNFAFGAGKTLGSARRSSDRSATSKLMGFSRVWAIFSAGVGELDFRHWQSFDSLTGDSSSWQESRIAPSSSQQQSATVTKLLQLFCKADFSPSWHDPLAAAGANPEIREPSSATKDKTREARFMPCIHLNTNFYDLVPKFCDEAGRGPQTVGNADTIVSLRAGSIFW